MRRLGWHSWLCMASVLLSTAVPSALEGGESTAGALQAGIAVRDITPSLPIWLAGYAARKKPAEKIDHPLLAQALALRDAGGNRFVFVALDNCEVSAGFVAPVLEALEARHRLKAGEVLIAGTHTHSAPVLEGALEGMYPMSEADTAAIVQYSQRVRERLIEVVGAALADLQPATLEHAVGRATFAMNRRVYREDQMAFGENLDGPVDWEVPVLTVKGANATPRMVLFGYACHGTSIQGEDFYIVSGDYMGYARLHLESVLPGTVAMYLPGMGADSNPSPRGTLLDARRHGLELAGAITGVVTRPMRSIQGPLRLAFERIKLPLEAPPPKEQLEKDAASQDLSMRTRASRYLRALAASQPLPEVALPVGVLRLGHDLTFVALGGEVVVDYSRRFKRLLEPGHTWAVSYAYDVPCYIPSIRILKEGGYEAQSSLIYYGLYGPFRTKVEDLVVQKVLEFSRQTLTGPGGPAMP